MWEHFKKKKINGEIKAVCNYCKAHLVGDGKKGTRHLHDHYGRCLKRKHQDIQYAMQNQKRLKIDERDGKLKITNYTFDQEVCRKKVATMIILHELPLCFVEYHGFRELCQSLQPAFKMISRTTLKSDILKIYDVEKQKTMKLLERNRSRIAITTDMWTSSNQKKGFMAVTAHWIDDSWLIQNQILR